MTPSERTFHAAGRTYAEIWPVETAKIVVEQAGEDHAKRAATLRTLADEEDAKQAAKEAKDALLSRIENEEFLAFATTLLLDSLRKLVNGESVNAQLKFATFRKELTPLAESYGYKLVLVGNKAKAALTVL